MLGRCSCTRDSCNIPPSICSPKTGKKKGNKQEKNTYFNRNLFGLFDRALKTNTIREVFPRSAGNVQEIAIEVELMNIYQGSNTFLLIFGKLTKSLKCDINFKKKIIGIYDST